VTPCPGCLGDFRIDAEVPTTPVLGKGFAEGRCVRDLGMVPHLTPGDAYCTVGNTHQLTATVVCAQLGQPQPNVPVRFTVMYGPHAGVTGIEKTDANGQAFWSYTGEKLGTDTIVAEPKYNTLASVNRRTELDESYEEISRQVYVTWVEEDKPTLPPSMGFAWKDILLDGFEGDFPGSWEIREKDTPIANWGKDGYTAHGGSYSAFCAKDGPDGVTPPENYPNDMASSMVFGPFDLSDAALAELNYYYWLKSGDANDRLWCLASLDGTHFYGQYRSGDSEGWQYMSFKLNTVFALQDITGQTKVWIAFRFISDSSGGDIGAFVDDVQLRKWVPNFPVIPDIRANGSDYPISVSRGNNVQLSIGMDTGQYAGEKADWFLLELAPNGSILYYDTTQGMMVEGIALSYQGPLFFFDDTAIFNLRNLSTGRHWFYFGVDLKPNGVIDTDCLFYDGAQVEIPKP
jgi:hypothetical protein